MKLIESEEINFPHSIPTRRDSIQSHEIFFYMKGESPANPIKPPLNTRFSARVPPSRNITALHSRGVTPFNEIR